MCAYRAGSYIARRSVSQLAAVAVPVGVWHRSLVMIRFVLCVGVLATAVHAQPVPGVAPPALAAPIAGAPPPEDESLAGTDGSFAAWLADFRSAELAKGVTPAALDVVLGGLRYSPRVVELDRAQPNSAARPTTFASYAERHIDGVLIARGRGVHAALESDFARDEATTGVPGAVVLGIWGMESSYGAVTGGFDVPRSLATLAFDGRRRDLFTSELAAVVAIVARGGISRDRLTGSWAGAMGQAQFLPSTYLAFARDGDGDGRADIWTSRPDIALSIATKLAADGWRAGTGWGVEVMVPAELDRSRVRNLVAPTKCPRVFEKHSRWLSVAEWRALGLTSAAPGGTPGAWPADTTLATLSNPTGRAGGRS